MWRTWGQRRAETLAALRRALLAFTLLYAVGVGLRYFGNDERVPGVGTASVAVVIAVAAAVSAYLADRLPGRDAYRNIAAGLGVGAFGVAVCVIVGRPDGVWAVGAGALVAAGYFIRGLLRLPGGVNGLAPRLGLALDGLIIAACLSFTMWMLFFVDYRPGTLPHAFTWTYGFVLTVALLSATVVGIGMVAAIRATGFRRAHILLAVGLSIVALAGPPMVIGVDIGSYGICRAAMLSWGAGTILVAIALWIGLRSPGAAKARPIPHIGLLVTLVPTAIAGGAAIYQAAVKGPLRLDTVIAAVFVVAALISRQILTRFDVRRAAEQLADREAYFRSIVAGSSEVITVLDDDLVVRWQSPSSTWRMDWTEAQARGRSFDELVHPDDAAPVRKQLTRALTGEPVILDGRIMDADGVWRDTESTVADHRAVPQVRGLVVHTRDVGDRKQLERELARMAYADPLTGLANRRQLLRKLENDVAGSGIPCTMLAIDLDEFKNVNDLHGHDVGDEVLVEVAERLRANLRPTDLGARLGGDEFAVLLWCGVKDAGDIAERLLAALSEPYDCGRTRVFLSISIGVAGCGTADDVETLMRNADLALRFAKERGKNRIERYDADFEALVRRRTTLEQELRGANERGELHLVYQPVVALPGREIVGAEALLRWTHPTLGSVSPAEFIPAAESAGIMDELTAWSLRETAGKLSQWRAAGHRLWVSLNVGVRQLHSPNFAVEVAQSLVERGVPPHQLVVEITEHDVAYDVNRLVAQLTGLRATGVRIALDDFGAGYSSLGQLHRLPVDIIKIDRALVVGAEDGTAPLSDVVVRLGERLGLDVIAEGVETEPQLAHVVEAGCPLGQGYLFHRPLMAADLEARLAEGAVEA